jgi:hypothetical protein
MDATIKTGSQMVDLSHMVSETLKAAVRSWPLYTEPRVSEIRGNVSYCVHICCRECEQSVFNAAKGDSAYVFDQNTLYSATLAHLLQRHGYEMNGTRNDRNQTTADA